MRFVFRTNSDSVGWTLCYANHATLAVLIVDLGLSLRIDADGTVRTERTADPPTAVAAFVIDDGPFDSP